MLGAHEGGDLMSSLHSLSNGPVQCMHCNYDMQELINPAPVVHARKATRRRTPVRKPENTATHWVGKVAFDAHRQLCAACVAVCRERLSKLARRRSGSP